MALQQEIVITGLGVVSPIGIGKDAYWASLCEGRSGVRRLALFGEAHRDLPPPFGGEVADFDAKQFVRPRKSLKVMNRNIQLAFAAAEGACADSGIRNQGIDPERFGVLFGDDLMAPELDELVDCYRRCTVEGRFDFSRWGQAMTSLFPLWLLKYLPNMPACHIAIAQEAHGHNNTITMAEASGLLAVFEAVRVLQRGRVDAMIVGSTGSQLNSAVWTRSGAFPFSRRADDPAAASRPFDARRDGWVNGEGAAAFILETRRHAEARGAAILARVLGSAAAFEPHRKGQPLEGRAIRQAIRGALRDAGIGPRDIGHVNANGLSTPHDDRVEARAIADTLGDVPVTAPKSLFGRLAAGAGAVEMAASVLALVHGLVPATLNYEFPDPECPVNVIHGRPLRGAPPTAITLNDTPEGQAVAVVLAGA